ncbi:MAG: 2-oxo acid dehydrogenase subunit E2 [Chloroflexi bacterium]|nr:MAG: 2-oxo acid dehydrogenase subunit E2 [Chloroflexota bacterium]
MSEVNMPKLSDTMEEGTIVEWKKSSGDEVHKGDVLAEVESDKATFDLEAESDGTLEIIVEKGVPAKIGAAIARIGAGGAAKPAEKKAPPPKAEPKHEAKAEPKQEVKPKPETVAEGPADNQASEPAPPTRRGSAAPTSPRRGEDGETAEDIKASPLAKRIADEMGVDLRGISGTGPEGRIVKEDVLAAAGGGARSERRRPESPAAPSGPEVEVIEPTRMQATIAKRMAEAKATVPNFNVTVEARVDEAVKLRQQLKESVPGAEKVTMTDMLMRACALALRRFPEVNSSWVDGRFQRKRSINIGLAVPPSQGLGLLVPVVHDVDRKDLVQISIESRQVIERARSGRPGEHDLSGATFSISNLGMYGVDEFVAIINPPESAILAVGAIKDVAVVEDGRIVPGKVMRMTLSVDHRVFYGQTAAQFMAEVKRLIENPVTLVVPAG